MSIQPTIKPTLKQHQVWEATKDNKIRYIFFGGGAGGGKSWFLAEWLLTNCYFYPGTKWFIGRNELKRLMASSYVTFTKVCKFHNIPDTDWKLNGQYNYIEFNNGSRIDLLDLSYKPSDEMYERLGSLEYTGGAIDEMPEIKFKAFDVLKSRIGRHMNKEYGIPPKLIGTGNPNKNWVYKLFYLPTKKGNIDPKYKFIQSLYSDNPHTAKEYEESLSDIHDYATKQRLKYGNWEYDDDENALVDYDSIQDLFTNTIEPSEEKYLTVDVARFGGDKIVMMFWKGLELYKIKTMDRQAINITADIIKQDIVDEMIPRSRVLIDEVGVGGGVIDSIPGVKGFIANASPMENIDTQKTKVVRNGKIVFTTPKENYATLKDQCGYMLADKINQRQIKISATVSDEIVETIEEELGQLKRKDADKDVKLRLIPKDEIKENIGHSPDYLDTLLMRMRFDLLSEPQLVNEFNNDKFLYI